MRRIIFFICLFNLIPFTNLYSQIRTNDIKIEPVKKSHLVGIYGESFSSMKIDSVCTIENKIWADSLFELGDYVAAKFKYGLAANCLFGIIIKLDTNSYNFKVLQKDYDEMIQQSILCDSIINSLSTVEYYTNLYQNRANFYLKNGLEENAFECYLQLLSLNPSDSISRFYLKNHIGSIKPDTLYVPQNSKVVHITDSNYRFLKFETDIRNKLFWFYDSTAFNGCIVHYEVDKETNEILTKYLTYQNGIAVEVNYYTSKSSYLDWEIFKILNSNTKQQIPSNFNSTGLLTVNNNSYQERIIFDDSTHVMITNYSGDSILNNKFIRLNKNKDTLSYYTTADNVHEYKLYEEGIFVNRLVVDEKNYPLFVTYKVYNYKNNLTEEFLDYIYIDTLKQFFYEGDSTFKLVTINNSNGSQFIINENCYYMYKRKFISKFDFFRFINYYNLEYLIIIYPIDIANGIYIPIVISSKIKMDLTYPEDEAKFRKKLTKELNR